MYPPNDADPQFAEEVDTVVAEIITDTRVRRGTGVTVTHVGSALLQSSLHIRVNQYANAEGQVLGLQILCADDTFSFMRKSRTWHRTEGNRNHDEYIWSRVLCLSHDQGLNTTADYMELLHQGHSLIYKPDNSMRFDHMQYA